MCVLRRRFAIRSWRGRSCRCVSAIIVVEAAVDRPVLFRARRSAARIARIAASAVMRSSSAEMRPQASPTLSTSRIWRTCSVSISSRVENSLTTMTRPGLRVTNPSLSRRFRASRTGVREISQHVRQLALLEHRTDRDLSRRDQPLEQAIIGHLAQALLRMVEHSVMARFARSSLTSISWRFRRSNRCAGQRRRAPRTSVAQKLVLIGSFGAGE